MKELFRKISSRISSIVGSAGAFLFALLVVIVWAISGPLFHFSDTWQLVINTGTTIVTFLMVFLIQNTQNRDSKAIHLKLDELIRSGKTARTELVGLEDLTDEEVAALDEEFKALHEKHNTNAMHKLHTKIAAEKQRRISLRGAGSAIKSFLSTPLNTNDDSKSKK